MENMLAHQFIGPISAVPVEAHVTAFMEALVGEPTPAASALATEIHEVDHPGRAGPEACAGPCRRDGPRGFVPRRNLRAVQKLSSLGATQGITGDPDQQLPVPRF